MSIFKSQYCIHFSPVTSDRKCLYYDPADNDWECGFCKHPHSYRCLADTSRIIPLSHSLIQNYLSCSWLCYLTNIRGVRVKKAHLSSPLKRGLLWDLVLQRYLGGKDKSGNPIDINKIISTYEMEDRDVAIVRAIFRAYKTLEITVEPNYELQSKIDLQYITETDNQGNPYHWSRIAITGFYDRKYHDKKYFVENKLSGRPERYQDPFMIQSQVGTYFLADPDLKYCIMEVVRTPDLKPIGSYKDEDADTYEERCYQDIISRPSHYFIGYSHEKHTYGKKFFRDEFDLEEIKRRYESLAYFIQESWMYNRWYKEDKSCGSILPGIKCDMLSACRYNKGSETLYEIRRRE